MNLLKNKSRDFFLTTAAFVIAVLFAGWPLFHTSLAIAAGKGLDVEVPYEINALKTPGLTAPYFLQEKDGNMIVSDQAGGVFSVTFGGKVTEIAGKAKLKYPAGVAIGASGFGSYTGDIFVLNASDEKGPCEVMRMD